MRRSPKTGRARSLRKIAAELERLVGEAEKERPAGVTQSNVQAGDQNRAANVSGSGNAVNVS